MNPTLPNHGMRPAAAAVCQAPGNWRLDQLPKASFPLLALFVSAGFHAAFLLAFNGHAPRIIRFAPPVATAVDPWPVPNDPEPPPTDVKEFDDPPVVSIPRLTDLPSRLDLQNAFVQKLEPNAPLPKIKGDRVLKIPINAGNGGPRALSPGTFSPDQLDRAPRVVAQPAPPYPREMQNLAISAEVVVAFIVDTTGAVQSATIVSSTHPGFDRAALDGVRRWKFRPGLKDGRTVNTRMLQPIRFSLDEHPGT